MGEDEAARVIQAGFKNLKRRNTGSSIVTVVPNGNGTTAGEGELVDHVHDLTIRFIKTQVPGSLSLKGFQDIVRNVQNQTKQFRGACTYDVCEGEGGGGPISDQRNGGCVDLVLT